MKNILLLPIFRFGIKQNSITLRIIEIYSRINRIRFNFIINLDDESYKDIDPYYATKIRNMDKSFGYSGKNIIKLFSGIIKTFKTARRTDYLICESEYFYSVLYSYIIHIMSKKSLIIVINHVDDDMFKHTNMLHYLIFRHIFRKTNKFLISDDNNIIKAFSDNFKIKNENLFRINDGGIEVKSFYKKNDKVYDIIFIGNIEERKNAFMLPDIVEKLKNYNTNIKLLIISHAGEIDQLRHIITLKNLDNNIDFIGYISEAQKIEYLAESKIMIFPSKYEGFGTVIAEGLASYLPVIIFDVPTLKIFDKGVVKVEPFNIHEYVKKIIYLLENESIRILLGVEGRHDVEQRFDYDYVSKLENESITKAITLIDSKDYN